MRILEAPIKIKRPIIYIYILLLLLLFFFKKKERTKGSDQKEKPCDTNAAQLPENVRF